MSNEKKSPGVGCRPGSPSSSWTPSTSSDGATTTPSASSTLLHVNLKRDADELWHGLSTPTETLRHRRCRRSLAAAGYTERITAVAERIVEAKDQATVHALLTEGVRALGADNAVFVSFIRDNADLSACRFMLVCETRLVPTLPRCRLLRP